MSKTQGLCRSQYSEISNLPPIKWTKEALNILGLVIGNTKTKSVEKHWKQCIKHFSEEIQNLTKYVLTWEAKALLSKTKLLPLISYNSTTYPIPTKIKEKINNKLENFLTENFKLKVPINILALPRNQGGYNVANITLYADLFLSRSIQEYCRHRKNETPLTPSLALVEYNAGLQLSSLYSLKHKNNLQHAFRPMSNIFIYHSNIKKT